jgi:hypothetical protein
MKNQVFMIDLKIDWFKYNSSRIKELEEEKLGLRHDRIVNKMKSLPYE